MSNNNSKSSSKSIEQLLNELSDLHKQFDSINIEKTMSLNNSNSVNNNDSSKVTNHDRFNDIKDLKPKTDILTLDSKKVKPSQLVIGNNDFNENIEKQVNEIRTVQLETNPQTPKNKVNTLKTVTIDLTKNNSGNDNLNESYLSIKDKLQKIKSEIEEKEKSYDMRFSNVIIKSDVKINNTKESKLTTSLKEKKLVNKVKNADDKILNDTKSINKQSLNNNMLNEKKSNVLTIIILTLVIVILLSVYFYFFR